MDRFNKLSGGVKTVITVFFVLVLTGALVLLAAEKAPAEKAERGFLGVSVQSLDDEERGELGVTQGVRVERVENGSAAEKAGILKDDVIQSVNGEKVRSPQGLSDIVRELAPGSTAQIGIRRSGKPLELKAVLGKYERPKLFHWDAKPLTKILRTSPYLGVKIMSLDDDLASYFSVKAGEGVLVTGVEKESPAAKAGFKSGDVIVKVGDKAVKKSGDIQEALADVKKGDSVTLTVVRRGKKESLKATPDFDRHRRVLRFFSGDKDIEIEHLGLPELDIEIPEAPPVPPPPDCDEIVVRVREKLGTACEKLERVRERMDGAKIRVEKRLREISENYWI